MLFAMNIIKYFKISVSVGRRDFECAVNDCRLVLSRNPDDVFSLSLLTEIFYSNNQNDDALHYATRLLNIDNENIYAAGVVAIILAEKKDYHSAHKYAQKLLDITKPKCTNSRESIFFKLRLEILERFRIELPCDIKYDKTIPMIRWAESFVYWYNENCNHSQHNPDEP